MEQKNLDFLKNQLKYTGFGESVNEQLEKKLLEQKPNFSLIHQAEFGNSSMSVMLHFSKSNETENYFFNSYDALLKNGNNNTKQTFYVDKGSTFTLKEAFNLLSGRAVNKDLTTKEGQAYNAWQQLDFKNTNEKGNYLIEKYHEKYGYDLPGTLAKYPIKELQEEATATKLIDSLKKGNRQSVTFVQDGQESKHFIEANPKYLSLTFYDSNMQRQFSHLAQAPVKEVVAEEKAILKQQTKKNENLKSSQDVTEKPRRARKSKSLSIE